MELELDWRGRMEYREAWAVQHELATRRARGEIGDRLLLLEHPAVLTIGRHAPTTHIRASADALASRGIELLRVERGGDVTYHGPGQLVAYPIVHLAERGILLRPFVRALELAMIDTARSYGVESGRRDGHPGCWCDPDGRAPRKLGALGLRIERGVTYHGIGLNVTTDLDDFGLIDPCGMPDVTVTSIAREARWVDARPSTDSVRVAADRFGPALAARLRDAPSRDEVPTGALVGSLTAA